MSSTKGRGPLGGGNSLSKGRAEGMEPGGCAAEVHSKQGVGNP